MGKSAKESILLKQNYSKLIPLYITAAYNCGNTKKAERIQIKGRKPACIIQHSLRLARIITKQISRVVSAEARKQE